MSINSLSFSLKRQFYYTGITKRNVLIKCRRQLQATRRKIDNGAVHLALKKNASGGQRISVHSTSCLCSTSPAVKKTGTEEMKGKCFTHARFGFTKVFRSLQVSLDFRKKWSRTEGRRGGSEVESTPQEIIIPMRADNPSIFPCFPLLSIPAVPHPQMTNSEINRLFQRTENISGCS